MTADLLMLGSALLMTVLCGFAALLIM